VFAFDVVSTGLSRQDDECWQARRPGINYRQGPTDRETDNRTPKSSVPRTTSASEASAMTGDPAMSCKSTGRTVEQMSPQLDALTIPLAQA